jgi:uncharacterized protein YaiE (UPF0345 family)
MNVSNACDWTVNRMKRSLQFSALVAAAALLLPILPGTAFAAPTAAMPSDFNGDGYADLAIGARSDEMRGSVNVLYGGPAGLTAAGDQRWTQDSPGVRNQSERKDLFGDAVASGDFDADGYADLAIGVPGEGTNGTARAGAIEVLHGSSTGLIAAGDQLWTIDNLPGASDLRWLGAALTAADIDGDGYWDLAAGAPNTSDLDGAVVVLFGSADGLTADGLVRYDRSATGAENDPVVYYGFGNVVAAGDLDGDGYADLAAGFGANGTLGEAVIVYGSPDGPVTTEAELWSQAVPGMEQGFDEAGDFGAALVIADFDGDGYDDLAAGAPTERGAVDPMNTTAAGGVSVIYGSADGLTTAGNQLWRQSTQGVPGHDEAWDSFGRAVAAGHFNADAFADLAIGVPGEDAEDFSFGPGAVTILYGSADGLTAAGAQRWSQASPGIPSSPQLTEWFGRTLVSHDFGRSARDDLAIGVPNESVAGVKHAGMVEVLYGTADGLSANHAQAWTWVTPGVAGPLTNDYFGLTLGG